VPDGVNSIVIGKLGTRSEPLLFIGGNCSIQGFDWKGNEVFWTVTADNIRSMILMDIDADGQNEVGTRIKSGLNLISFFFFSCGR
jgi:hypothetical protein